MRWSHYTCDLCWRGSRGDRGCLRGGPNTAMCRLSGQFGALASWPGTGHSRSCQSSSGCISPLRQAFSIRSRRQRSPLRPTPSVTVASLLWLRCCVQAGARRAPADLPMCQTCGEKHRLKTCPKTALPNMLPLVLATCMRRATICPSRVTRPTPGLFFFSDCVTGNFCEVTTRP